MVRVFARKARRGREEEKMTPSRRHWPASRPKAFAFPRSLPRADDATRHHWSAGAGTEQRHSADTLHRRSTRKERRHHGAPDTGGAHETMAHPRASGGGNGADTRLPPTDQANPTTAHGHGVAAHDHGKAAHGRGDPGQRDVAHGRGEATHGHCEAVHGCCDPGRDKMAHGGGDPSRGEAAHNRGDPGHDEGHPATAWGAGGNPGRPPTRTARSGPGEPDPAPAAGGG
ncbi:hypothetical protein C2845_PM03G33410 [Panicum miliaceum]|uniref:Uncharacterized protein n=1 Tax=Panicum miliaceum TaxID=4540 RepID=A0A3L6T8K4_PANMI|nr:hypothetical protein C2845_PM03G33410 [Panicum miliaceum]